MRNKFLRRISCIGVLVLMLMSTPAKAIDNSALDIYSQNDIIFYDPTNCEGSSGTKQAVKHRSKIRISYRAGAAGRLNTAPPAYEDNLKICFAIFS